MLHWTLALALDWTAVALLAALPVVGGLQRFSVAYGYQGLSRAEARRSAFYAALGYVMLEAMVVAINPSLIGL